MIKKKFFRSYQFFLLIFLFVFAGAIGLINPSFFSMGTLFDVIRIQTIYILLGFGLLPVVILGGVDMSFVAIGALASFPIHYILEKAGYEGGIGLYYLWAIVIGIGVGALISFLLTTFKLKIFDLSLGMNTLIYGFIVFFIDSRTNANLPEGLVGWNKKFMVTVHSVVGDSGLHISFLYIILAGILLHLLLNYTTLGRSIYAFGSDKSVAIRTGYNIRKTYLVVFALMGLMAGIAGVTYNVLQGNFRPYTFMGKNRQVLAAVVLGGASTKGGRGTVFGTLLGTFLVGLINQAIVYLGFSTQWFDAVIGVIFIIYAAFQSLTLEQKR